MDRIGQTRNDVNTVLARKPLGKRPMEYQDGNGRIILGWK
jgi:hypothetical protein